MLKKILPLFLLLVSLSAVPVSAENNATGQISGQIMISDGQPLSDGNVVFFNAETGAVPDPQKYLRIPDELGNLDQEGRFLITLPVGKYYMGAIKRMSGKDFGPPLDGDYFFINRDKDGILVQYVIEKDKTLDIAGIAGAVPFKHITVEKPTGITGTIRDLNGEPVAGAVVFAYVTETLTGLPPFTSYKTGSDGKYLIKMEAGTYYLRVRDLYGGGQPVPGAIMGIYGNEKPVAVRVRKDELTTDVNISVERHMERALQMMQTGKVPDKNNQGKIKEEMQKHQNQP